MVEFFDLAGAGQQDLRGPAVPLLIRHPNGQLIANPARELQLQAGDVLVVLGQASDLNPLDRDQDTGTSSRARHMPGRGPPPRA